MFFIWSILKLLCLPVLCCLYAVSAKKKKKNKNIGNSVFYPALNEGMIILLSSKTTTTKDTNFVQEQSSELLDEISDGQQDDVAALSSSLVEQHVQETCSFFCHKPWLHNHLTLAVWGALWSILVLCYVLFCCFVLKCGCHTLLLHTSLKAVIF